MKSCWPVVLVPGKLHSCTRERNFVFVHFAVISSFVLVAEAGVLHILLYVFGAKIYICVSRGKTNCVRFPRIRFVEMYDRDCHHVLFVV